VSVTNAARIETLLEQIKQQDSPASAPAADEPPTA
jgi:hypothetical protein